MRYESLSGLFRAYIFRYYDEVRDANPGIIVRHEKHLLACNELDREFRDELKTYREWDDADARELLKDEIDRRTGVYSQEKERIEKEERNIERRDI